MRSRFRFVTHLTRCSRFFLRPRLRTCVDAATAFFSCLFDFLYRARGATRHILQHNVTVAYVLRFTSPALPAAPHGLIATVCWPTFAPFGCGSQQHAALPAWILHSLCLRCAPVLPLVLPSTSAPLTVQPPSVRHCYRLHERLHLIYYRSLRYFRVNRLRRSGSSILSTTTVPLPWRLHRAIRHRTYLMVVNHALTYNRYLFVLRSPAARYLLVLHVVFVAVRT